MCVCCGGDTVACVFIVVRIQSRVYVLWWKYSRVCVVVCRCVCCGEDTVECVFVLWYVCVCFMVIAPSFT